MQAKRWSLRFTKLITVSFVALFLMTAQPASALKFISFGTGSPAGTYYFLGAGFASLINNNVPNVRVAAEST